MFGIDPIILAIIGLAAISAGAVSYGVLFSRLENEKKAQSRFDRVKSAETDRVKIKASRDRLQAWKASVSPSSSAIGRICGVTPSSAPRWTGKRKQKGSFSSNRTQWFGRVKRQFIVKV